MRSTKIILTALLTFASAANAIAAQPATTADEGRFIHPERIRYDNQCFTIDGKDIFIFSGAFHYFRCPKELWHDRFVKIKQAGFNTVETYVPWNWHEREMPSNVDDFSKVDLKDLSDWLRMAQDEFGFYTIIRPGPYICAEWAGGGFPAWLLTKRPADLDPKSVWLRTDDPVYLAWCEHWIKACCGVIAPQQITRRPPGKGGVILFQIENEYDLYGPPNQSQRLGQLKSLAADARRNGIDVPLFTCVTSQTRKSTDPDLKNVFDAVNSYSRWNLGQTGRAIDGSKKSQPQAPGMVSELQGGWFSGVGGTLAENQDGVDASQCNGITLMAMSHGATVLNYYMLFGGTNFGDWGSREQTTTYDYDAPIRETGGVGDKYAVVYGIGHMLQKYGTSLARAKPMECKMDKLPSDITAVARRAPDGITFVFLWNRSRQAASKGDATARIADDSADIKVHYNLEPFGFKVLILPSGSTDSTQGQWMPQPMPPIARPEVPAAIKIAKAQTADDPLPKTWQDVPENHSLAALGIYDSRYVYYRTTATLTAEQARHFNVLRIRQDQPNPIVVRINGKLIAGKAEFERHDVSFALGDALHAGENQVLLLYESVGYPNFGNTIESTSGLLSGEFIYRNTPDLMLQQWRSKLLDGDHPEAGDAVKAQFDDSQWPTFVLDAQTAPLLGEPIQPGAEGKNAAGRILAYHAGTAVFRTHVLVTQKMLDEGVTQIIFGMIDDRGTVYVNGTQAGRADDYKEPLVIDAGALLKPGDNVIAAVVINRDGPGGLLRPVKITGGHVDQFPLRWQIAPNLGGVEAGWTKGTQPADGDWKPVALDGSTGDAAPDSTVRWYRVEFATPLTKSDAWIPWMAHFSASGNGMIYLNGHHLGRWWDIGPQTDYFLPECWLRAGSAGNNELTFSLRRTDRGHSLNSVEIIPCKRDAETR